MILLYTDGLVESTGDILAGTARLRQMLARSDVRDAPHPAATLCRLMLAPDEGRRRGRFSNDDVAVLTVTATREIARWRFPPDDATSAMDARRELVALLRATGASAADLDAAELVFGELLGNAVRHTHGPVDAALDLSGTEPVLHVLDRGPGFTYHARLPNDKLSEGGRGLFIISKFAREVSVEMRPDGGSHARVVLAAPGLNFLRNGKHRQASRC
jgi:anti-sigma regulatory factor (Ser/Thr protein kinase)